MAEDGQVNAILVQERLEGSLAGAADVTTAPGRVPGTVTPDYNPGGDGAINGGEVGLEEFQLLVCGAEWAAV